MVHLPSELAQVKAAVRRGHSKGKIRRGSIFIRSGHHPTVPSKDLDTPTQGWGNSYLAPGLRLL